MHGKFVVPGSELDCLLARLCESRRVLREELRGLDVGTVEYSVCESRLIELGELHEELIDSHGLREHG